MGGGWRPGCAMENWEDHKDYMFIKRRKLDNQQDAIGELKSSLFLGVTIYVNGYTQPDSDTLKELIHVHGGVYEYAPSSRVTHVIASNLPTAKIKKLPHSVVVCTPQWITDSIANNKLLPVKNYELYTILGKSQSKLEMMSSSSFQTSGNKQGTDMSPFLSSSPNKDFVTNFYSHSRLHYLSTWSSQLKDFVNKTIPQATRKLAQIPSSESLRKDEVRAICHVDVDCFFVSVSIQNMPHLKGKPVAVTHASKRTQHTDQNSTSDISSCSYEAREYGIYNGMSVGKATALCPELVLVPYDFEKYQQVSQLLYETVIEYSHMVQAVSCDEVFIEFTDYAHNFNEVQEIVKCLRADIQKKTNCTVSVGISSNMLLARLATTQAKPNGQFYLSENKVQEHLFSLPVSKLPGIGWSLTGQLKSMCVTTCGELQEVSLSKLQRLFGMKTGHMLYCFARGIDVRELSLKSQRKSLSVDMNYGIRFTEMAEAETLVYQLSKELHSRAADAKVEGTSLCLKIKIKKPDAPLETKKYLGHGSCDNISRSNRLVSPTNNAEEIAHSTIHLLKQINPDPVDIRGMGIQLNGLLPVSEKSSSMKMTDIRMSFNNQSDCVHSKTAEDVFIRESMEEKDSSENMGIQDDESLNLPPVSQLDVSVLLQLPPNLQEEVFDKYDGCSDNSDCTQLPVSTDEYHEDFIKDIRTGIKQWVVENPHGPSLEEKEQFSEFLLQFADQNLEVTNLMLKHFRRLLLGVDCSEWICTFNCILYDVQTKIQSKLNGKLLIDKLYYD